MTEDEAKTKWCPMADKWFMSVQDAAPYDESAHIIGNNCIGSACMMWRDEIAVGGGIPIEEIYSIPKIGKIAARRVHEILAAYGAQKDARRRGYCGLAGKP